MFVLLFVIFVVVVVVLLHCCGNSFCFQRWEQP